MKQVLKESFKRWIPIIVEITILSAIIYQFPQLWHVYAEFRQELPIPCLSSFRNWSLINWGLWVIIASDFARKKLGRLKGFLAGVAIFVFLFGMGDWIWTLTNNLRWRILTPDQSWLILQPGNETHLLVLLVLSLLASPFMLWFYKKRVFDTRVFLLIFLVKTVYWLLKVLVAPNPGWTDWGYLTMFHPELQESIPKFFVFFVNDIMDRMLTLFAIICGGVSFEKT